MFNKTTNTPAPPQPRRPNDPVSPAPEAQSAAARRPTPPRPASLLGPDLVFEGQISGDGELQVEGCVRGEVQVARLVIGENAQVEGTVRGAQVEIRGRVTGNVEAKQVKLYETAHVEGDIVHEQLSIDVGAYFQGRCQQMRPAPKPATEAPSAKIIELDKSAQA